MNKRLLTPGEITLALSAVGDVLARDGHSAEMYVGGGAAIALRFGESGRALTEDVDALFRKNPHLVRAAAEVARDHGLPGDWLNDKFAPFVPSGEPDDQASTIVFGGLTVKVASTEHLVAMKFNAGRSKDADDIILLLGQLDLQEASQVADLVTRIYGEDAVPTVDWEEVRLFAEDALRRVVPRQKERSGSAPVATTSRCRRCNSPLRSAESIAKGIGPSCESLG